MFNLGDCWDNVIWVIKNSESNGNINSKLRFYGQKCEWTRPDHIKIT